MPVTVVVTAAAVTVTVTIPMKPARLRSLTDHGTTYCLPRIRTLPHAVNLMQFGQ